MHIARATLFVLLVVLLAWPMATVATERKTPMAPEAFLKMTNPVPLTDAALKEAATVYENRCNKCHGTNGDGNGSATRELAVKPRNYTDKNLMAAIPDGQLYWIIMNGSDPEETEMSGYKKKLSEEQMWKLVHYIRTFAR
jgi:mono/diheme cytochrome c family protein